MRNAKKKKKEKEKEKQQRQNRTKPYKKSNQTRQLLN